MIVSMTSEVLAVFCYVRLTVSMTVSMIVRLTHEVDVPSNFDAVLTVSMNVSMTVRLTVRMTHEVGVEKRWQFHGKTSALTKRKSPLPNS